MSQTYGRLIRQGYTYIQGIPLVIRLSNAVSTVCNSVRILFRFAQTPPPPLPSISLCTNAWREEGETENKLEFTFDLFSFWIDFEYWVKCWIVFVLFLLVSVSVLFQFHIQICNKKTYCFVFVFVLFYFVFHQRTLWSFFKFTCFFFFLLISRRDKYFKYNKY